MKRAEIFTGTVAALAMLTIAAPASAARMISTYSGVLTRGEDRTGYFNTGSADLAGRTVTLQFEYEVERAGLFFGDRQTGFLALGGSSYGVPGAILTASVTINGRTFTTTLDRNNQVWRQADVFQELGQYDGTSDGLIRTFVANVGGSFTGPYGEPVSGITGPGSIAFYVSRLSGETNPFEIVGVGSGMVTVTVRRAGAVPEPATWTMLILGFGAVGSLIRRQVPVQG